jgi:hypothetical protein
LKFKILIKITFSFLLILPSCISREKENSKELKVTDITSDSTKLFVTYKNSVFCVPSPQLINLYLKRLGIYPVQAIINPISNLEKYTTSAKKAVNFGVYGVDLGYMNIFSVSEKTNEYVAAVSQLATELNMGVIFTKEVYDQLLALKSDEDSLAHYLSGIFSRADLYMKANSQERTCALIIAGGWIESFYLLCNTYNNYKINGVRDLIFQQKFVLDNVIKSLAPFYESSSELQDMIDNLVEIAYDFDMLDFKCSYQKSMYNFQKGVMFFENECEVMNTSESMSTILKSIDKLRSKIIS